MEAINQVQEEHSGFFTKKKTLILIVLAIILVIEAVWAFQFLSSQGKNPIDNISFIPQQKIASLAIDPKTVSVTVGEQFTSLVAVDLGGREINGIDAVIHYDPSLLEVVESANGDLFENLLINEVDSVNGIISITASRISPDSQPITINGVLAAITFQALTQGETAVEFVFDPTQTNTSNVTEAKTSDNILTTVSNAQVTITSQ